MKVLMVCLGNICRSPMAEGVLRHLANERNIDLEIDSCGTAGYHIGEGPDHRAVATMRNKGIDISDLRARQFRVSDFGDFDLILPMDASNLSDVLALASSQEDEDKVKMMLEYAFPNESKAVPDPYYGGDDGFEHVYRLLDESCSILLDELQEA